jgi:hypothetical protein
MDAGNRSDQSEAGGVTGVALGTIVSASAAPYGYTVSVWSSGAILIHYHSAPTIGDVLLFAAGALLGFSLLGLVAHGALRRTMPLSPGPERVVAGALHWFAVGIALGAVILVAQLASWLVWPLGSFAATSLYLLVASLQLALVTKRSDQG